MRRLLSREVRVSDAALLANLERNVNFFASSCVLILAGLLTALTITDEVHTLINDVTFTATSTLALVELKLVTLICIFIYAFFTFTWSLRQYGFASVLVGAAPTPDEKNVIASERRSFAIYAAKVIDQASHSYNYGLRSFYFSMATITWFVGPVVFMVVTAFTIGVLFEREFLSKSLKALKEVENVGEKLFENDKELYRRSLIKPDK